MSAGKCGRCWEPVPENPKRTSEGEPYCEHCGCVFGTSVAPSSWLCEECGDIVLDHGGDDRPWCRECQVPMSCVHAGVSGVHGVGVDTQMDLGLALLCDAQEADFELGQDILRDSQQ